MKSIARNLLLLAMVLCLLCGLGLTAAAEDYTDYDTAIGYLDADSYKANVGTDPNFEANINQALAMVRENISGPMFF